MKTDIVRIIEEPSQLIGTKVHDLISTYGLLSGGRLGSDNAPREVVILKEGDKTTTICYTKMGLFFKRTYEVSADGKLQNLNSRMISRLNPKYWRYQSRLK